jgi:hypothetical protein
VTLLADLMRAQERRASAEYAAAQRMRWAVAMLWSCEPTDRALAGWAPLGSWSRKSFAQELGIGPQGVVQPQIGDSTREDYLE